MKKKRMEGRNMLEEALHQCNKRGYRCYSRNCEENNVLSDIVVVYVVSILMMRTWPFVDNGHDYNMFLLEAVGMTPKGKTFTIATAFMQNRRHIDQNIVGELILKIGNDGAELFIRPREPRRSSLIQRICANTELELHTYSLVCASYSNDTRCTDVDRKSQASMELKLGPITRARMKKLKASNGNEDNSIFEEFGDQGETSKLFTICSIRKDYSRKQLEGENWLSVGEGHPTNDGSPASTVAGGFLDKKG
ncbi:hypothetical protein M9H77_27121 [Catharanthus roseus]|uniref:Uncharacterized protein n=1 Tax=Catharanthus roseus TaxID=4058 RepID=A0ACC0AFV8_CATRO|nr:hypothetical protein M9H77_27121 [Catharanthus roseus]